MRVSLSDPDCGCARLSTWGLVDLQAFEWGIRASDEALLDYVTQARYGQAARPLIHNKTSAVIAAAVALLLTDVEAHALYQAGDARALRVHEVLEVFAELAAAAPAATWSAVP